MRAHRRLLLPVLLTAAAAAPATAAAKPAAGHYKGKTEQNRVVDFKVKKGKVVDFVAGVNTFCNTFGNNRLETDAIANLPAIKLKANGSFRYKDDEDATVEVSGRIKGIKAKGKVTLSRPDSFYDAAEGMTRFGACAGYDKAFTAKLR